MSESENQPTPPPPSSPKTSAVPLKKETVRITLRSRPGEGAVQPREATAPVNPVTSSVAPLTPPAPRKATAPVQLPSAPLPPPAPKAASSPVKLPPPAAPAPSPAAPAATVPMAPPPAPPAPGAPPAMSAPAAPRPPAVPRPPSAPTAPPKVETGATTAPLAKTVPLKPVTPAARPPVGSGTAPMAAAPGGAPATGALPKATVKLQQTQPMARPSISAPPSAPVKRTAAADSEQFYNDEKDPEEGLVPLSVVCFLLSAVLLVIQMFGSDRVSSSDSSPIMVPKPNPAAWERLNEDHTWSNARFQLPQIPQ